MSLTIKGDPKSAGKCRTPRGLGPPKTGRRASTAEREMAQEVVDLYREAVAAGGRLLLDPEDEQTAFYADPEFLLRALERFAQEGTFAVTMDFRPMTAKTIARAMKDARFEDKVAAVVDYFHVSEATAARWLRKRPTVKP